MAAYLNPTKHCGSAEGILIFKNTLKVEAPVVFANRSSSSLSDPKAKIAFRTMGKKQTRKTIMTFGRRPKPNHEMNNGAKAIFGVISILTKNGYMVLRKIDEKVMAKPRGIAITIAVKYPSIVSRPVMYV